MLSNIIIDTVIVFTAAFLIYRLYLKFRGKPRNTAKEKYIIPLCIMYFSVTVSILCIPYWNFDPFYFVIGYGEHFEVQNLIPFKTISGQISNIVNGTDTVSNIINLFVNTVILLPFPVCLKLISKNINNGLCLAASLLFSIAAECVQSCIGRVSDIDDVILNFAGAVVGLLIYVNVKKHLPPNDKKTDT